MKSQIKRIAVTSCFAVMSLIASAQIRPNDNLPLPPVEGPGMGPLHHGPQDIGPQRGLALRELTTLSGKVLAYQTNDRYAYNTFTLQNGRQVVTVRFPEQLGKQLMSAAGKGQSVTVTGFKDNGPDGEGVFQMASLVVGSTRIADTPPAIPVVPAVAQSGTYTGSISDFRRNPDGVIRGISLGNKLQIDLPPPAIEQLQSLLKTGDRIKVNGFKDTPPSGVVLAAGAPTVVHPETIEVNGKTYLLR